MTWLTVSVTNDHEFVWLVAITIPCFPNSAFVTKVARHVHLVEQELSTLPDHMKKSLKIPKWQSERKSTKGQTEHTYKTKARVTRTPLKTAGELRCSGRVSSSCSTSDTRRVNLVTNPVISHELGKDGKCLRQVEHIRGHL